MAAGSKLVLDVHSTGQTLCILLVPFFYLSTKRLLVTRIVSRRISRSKGGRVIETWDKWDKTTIFKVVCLLGPQTGADRRMSARSRSQLAQLFDRQCTPQIPYAPLNPRPHARGFTPEGVILHRDVARRRVVISQVQQSKI